jgi:hypothetical protein
VSLVDTVIMPVAAVPTFLTVYVAVVDDVVPMTAEPQLPLTGASAVIERVPGAVPVPLSVADPSVVDAERTFSVADSGPCAIGTNCTPMLHVLPAATVALLQVSLVTAKDVGFVPVRFDAMSAGDATSPWLVAVKLSVVPVVLVAAWPKSNPDVDVMRKLAGFCPKPDTDVLAVPPGVALADTDAICAPWCLAVKLTVTVQVAFGASAAAQPDAVNCVVSLVVTVGTPVVLVPVFFTV